MIKFSHKVATSLFLLAFTLTLQAESLNSVLNDATKQLNAEQYAKTYNNLTKYESQFSGNPDFDYMLALSASRSGHLGEALMALDRVLITQPNNGEALMLRATTYYQMGNYDQAKEDFEKIKAANPPPNIAKVADDYLKSIDDKQQSVKNSFNLGLDFGYNTNANSSYNGNIDILGNPALRTELEALGSTFNKLRFNWNIFWLFAENWNLNAGVYLEDQIVHFGTQLKKQETTLRDYSYLVALGYLDFENQINQKNKLSFGLSLTELVTSLRFEHLSLGVDTHINYQYRISNNFSYNPGLSFTYTAFTKVGTDPKTQAAYTEEDKLDANKNNFFGFNFVNNFKYLPLQNLILSMNLDLNYEKAKEIQNAYFDGGLGVRNGGDLIAVNTAAVVRYFITKEHLLNAKLKYKFSLNLKEDFNFQNEGKGDIKRQQHFISTGLGYSYIPFNFMKVNANLDFNYNKSNIDYFTYYQIIPTIGLDFYF